MEKKIDINEVSLIILNYNTKEMTEKCINSYIENFNNKIKYEIIIVDNNSSDGSQKKLQESYQYYDNVKFVLNDSNLGFGKGNNIGAEYASGEFLVFANSDTFPGDFEIINMIKSFENANIGVLSCKLLNSDGTIQTIGFNYPSLLNDFRLNLLFWNYNFMKRIRYKDYVNNGLTEKDWLSGAFFICKRADFKTINGFDATIFMYAEDLDLCARMKLLGKSNYVNDMEEVYHLHGKSGKLNLERLIQSKKNYKYVIEKNNLSKFPKVIFLMHLIHIYIIYSSKKLINLSKYRTKKTKTLEEK